MYNPNYYQIENYGWICSRCGRSYSPSVSMCPYCGGNSKIIYQGTSITPNWTNKEDTITSSIDDWWSTYLKQTTADSASITNNLFQTTTLDELLRSDFFNNNDLWEKPL